MSSVTICIKLCCDSTWSKLDVLPGSMSWIVLPASGLSLLRAASRDVTEKPGCRFSINSRFIYTSSTTLTVGNYAHLLCSFKVLWRKRDPYHKFLSPCMLLHPMETWQMPMCQRSSSPRLSYMDSPGWLQVPVMNPASSKQLRPNIHNTYIRASVSGYLPKVCITNHLASIEALTKVVS
jgi:hypothetical protein